MCSHDELNVTQILFSFLLSIPFRSSCLLTEIISWLPLYSSLFYILYNIFSMLNQFSSNILEMSDKLNSPLWLHHADHMFLTFVEIEFAYAFHFDSPLQPTHFGYHLVREQYFHHQFHDNPKNENKNPSQ